MKCFGSGNGTGTPTNFPYEYLNLAPKLSTNDNQHDPASFVQITFSLNTNVSLRNLPEIVLHKCINQLFNLQS